MGTADGGSRSGLARGSRGEPMAGAGGAVRARGSKGVLSDLAAQAGIKPLRSWAAFSDPVRVRPGSEPTARPRAGARDGGDRPAAVCPRSGVRDKEGGPA